MPFPISICGSVSVPGDADHVSGAAIILACVDQIQHEGARVATHSDRATTFTVPLISFGSNWRFTVPLSAGLLQITQDSEGHRRLRYDFSTRRTALIGTAMIFGGTIFLIASGQAQVPWWLAPVAWLWLVGANYLISYARAPSWALHRVTDAIKASAPAPPVLPTRN